VALVVPEVTACDSVCGAQMNWWTGAAGVDGAQIGAGCATTGAGVEGAQTGAG
jgi:hypothetical protein